MRTSAYLFESLDVLRDGLSFVKEGEQTLIEVSWNTDALELPLNVIVTFVCEEPVDASSSSSVRPNEDQVGILKIERISQPSEHHHQVRFGDCPRLIAARFDVDATHLKPRMMWRRATLTWRVILSHKDSARMSGVQREARLRIDAETSYYDVETGLMLACEPEVRAWALEGSNQQALQRLLLSRAHLPAVSAYWMSEYHYKRLWRLPTHQDLTGYEYEAKLSVAHLNFDELPSTTSEAYEIIERYQTESVRWYIKNVKLTGIGKVKKGRVGFRGARASLVSKGKKEKLAGGILKRTEEKSQGLNTWELNQVAREAKEMRRIKRQLYVRSKSSQRVYALCLDYCYVEGSTRTPLLQIELEYNGLLLITPAEWALTFERQLELAERFASSSPKVAQRSAERASWLLQREEVTPEALARYEALTDTLRARLLDEREEPEVATPNDPEIEREVLSEMRALLDALRGAHGYRATSKTKREWLKEELKTIDLEPLL